MDNPGFTTRPQVFTAGEMAALAAALSAAPLERSRAGARHLMNHPIVRALAGDARLVAIARELLHADPIPFRATLFDKSPAQNWLVVWHQDTALPLRQRRDVTGWGPWSVKAGITYAHAPAAALDRVVALRVHIDESARDNGPLRVIPGTHVLGVLPDDEVHRLAGAHVPHDCLTPTGGVVALRPLIIHASSKVDSNRPRRVLHIEYADSLQIDDQLVLAIA